MNLCLPVPNWRLQLAAVAKWMLVQHGESPRQAAAEGIAGDSLLFADSDGALASS